MTENTPTYLLCAFEIYTCSLLHFVLGVVISSAINTVRPRQNGRHFTGDILKCIFLNEDVWFPIKIKLNLVPQNTLINIPSLLQIMVWRRPGDKPLSEPVMVSLLTHICVTRRQWVNESVHIYPIYSGLFHWHGWSYSGPLFNHHQVPMWNLAKPQSCDIWV